MEIIAGSHGLGLILQQSVTPLPHVITGASSAAAYGGYSGFQIPGAPTTSMPTAAVLRYSQIMEFIIQNDHNSQKKPMLVLRPYLMLATASISLCSLDMRSKLVEKLSWRSLM